MKDKLCPVGGTVEEGETPAQAAVREFEEEAGIPTEESDWTCFAESRKPNSIMTCFVATSDKCFDAKTTTDEPISVMKVSDVLVLSATTPHLAAPDLIALLGLAIHATSAPSKVLIDYPAPTPSKSNKPR